MLLSAILKDTKYKLTQFNFDKIQALENSLEIKTGKDREYPVVNCLFRKKEIRLTPEEVIRQLYLMILIQDFGYSTDRMEIEYAVSFGREKKRADIIVFDKDQTTTPFIMVELKKPKLKDGKEQLKSYFNATKV
jgi:type I restriction enzyme M protein